MLPPNRLVLAFLLLAGLVATNATSQSAGLSASPELRAVQDALARGDRKAAARKLTGLRGAALENPDRSAQIALLEIALSPAPERMRRYLACAAAFSGREEGLTALIAALALAEARLEGRWPEKQREIEIVEEETDDEEPVLEAVSESDAEPTERTVPDAPALDEFLRAATPLVESWCARRPDGARVGLARRLLMRGRAGERVHRVPLLRIPTGTPIPVPSPLAEPLRVRVYRTTGPGADIRPYLEGAVKESPAVERVLPAGEIVADLEPLPAGSYVLEADSERSAWRHLRRIVVSDLRITAQAYPDGVVVLAALGNRPAAGVSVTIQERAGRVEHARGVTDSNGLVIFPLRLPEEGRNERLSLSLSARVENERGVHTTSDSVSLPDGLDANDRRAEFDAHVLTDRPLYRGGETIQGRVVVRVHRTAPAAGLLPAPGVKPVTEPAAERKLDLEVELPKSRSTVLNLVTDAWGVAAFSIPLPATAAPGEVRLSAWVSLRPEDRFAGIDSRKGERWVRILWTTMPARIQDYKRPPLLLDVAWPEVKRLDENPAIVVTARHPAGTPAAGLAGCATIHVGNGLLRDWVPFVLDSSGRAEVRVGLSRLEPPLDRSFRINAEVKVTAADGQRLTRSHTLFRHSPPSSRTDDEPSATIRVTGPRGRVNVGEPATVNVEGPAHAPVLLSVARETLFDCRVVTLDENGRAAIAIPMRREWWPSVFVVATGLDEASRRYSWRHPNRTRIQLEDPVEKLTVTLEKDHETYLPGERASWKLVTRDGNGRPVPATVSMAVVDETLFALARDRTRDPWNVLRPEDRGLCLDESRSPGFGSVWEALGLLLEGGLIPAPTWLDWLRAIGLGGGAGGRSYGGRGGSRRLGSEVRKDFRATAFFAPSIVTDDEGKAEVAFTFPDDLTTWRVTMCAVGRGREGALVREHVKTEKPLAVELELPRLFRKGDELAVPANAHQTGGAPLDAEIELTADGALSLAPADRRIELRTAPDAARGREVALTATAEGDARVHATLRSADNPDEVYDRLERKVPVVTRNARRVELDSALVTGRATLEPPILEGLPRQGPLTLEVLGSVEALLEKANAYLARYPHGCVEQTASKLTPLLLAIQAHRALGREGYGLAPEQAHRLEIGLARLRDLQKYDGGFSWWPGQSDSDPGMSAIAFRFLARMQDVGLDPANYGLRTDADFTLFEQAARSLQSAKAKEEDLKRGPFPSDSLALLLEPYTPTRQREWLRARAAAELTVARLLLHPKHGATAKLCATLAGHVDRLPTGLAARLGSALARAGDPETAGTVLRALRARLERKDASAPAHTLVESPACRAAALLELVLNVAPKDALRERLVGELMRRNRDGRLDHTAGTAAAVWALARERRTAGAAPPPPGAFTLAVTGEAEGETIRRELRCDPADGWSWSLELPGSLRRVEVEGPESRRLLVTARVAYAEDGAAAGGLERPIRIDRRLYRAVGQPNGSFERERLGTEVAQGDLLEVELAIEAPPDLDYLVMECPVPAGFEVIAQRGVIVRDDRVTLTVPWLPPGGQTSCTFRMVPARRGRVVWPPAAIEAMYAPEQNGRTTGASLTVTAPRPIAADAGHAELLTAANLDGLRKAWRDRIDPALQRGELIGRLRERGECMDRPTTEWLFETGPNRLGERLDDAEVCAAYLGALGPRLWDRLDAERLPELLQAMSANRAKAVDRLAFALVSAGRGEEAARRFATKRFRSPLEARVLGLAVIVDGKLPGDPRQKLDRARFLLEAQDQPSGEVRADAARERWSLVLERSVEGSYHVRHAYAHLITEPLRAAARSIWREGRLSIGNRETPELVTELIGHVDELVVRPMKRDPERIPRLARTLDDVFADAGWGGQGSAEPEGHREYRRHLAGALAELRTTVAPELVAWAREPSRSSPLWSLLAAPGLTNSKERTDLARSVLAPALDSLAANPEQPGLIELVSAILRSARWSPADAKALQPFAWRILGDGPRRLRASAFQVLSEADRRALPTAALLDWLRETPDSGWLVDALVARGPRAQAAALRCRGVLEVREQCRTLAEECEPGVLMAMPLDDLLQLIGRLDLNAGGATHLRIVDVLATGPWSGEAIAKRLARPGDVRVRTALLEACGARGVVPETWDPKDPAAERYRTLLAARHGDASAIETVRRWLWDSDYRVKQRCLLVWALGRAARVTDLYRLGTGPAADRLRREVLSRAPAAEIVAAWKPAEDRSWEQTDVDRLLHELPPEVAGALVKPALADWIENNVDTVTVLGRAPTPDLLAGLLPAVDSLGKEKALRLLKALESRADAVLPIALRLLAHPEAEVRERAAHVAYDVSGEVIRFRDAEGKQRRVGPERPDQYSAALRTRVARLGLRAVASALESPDSLDRAAASEWLSRQGLYLGN